MTAPATASAADAAVAGSSSFDHNLACCFWASVCAVVVVVVGVLDFLVVVLVMQMLAEFHCGSVAVLMSACLFGVGRIIASG